MTKPRVSAILTLLIAFTVGGCQAPDSKPFDQFAQAVNSLKGGADATLDQEYALELAHYRQKVLIGNDLTSLFLEPDPKDPFGWKANAKPPLYLKINQFKLGIGQLNDVLAKYAALLQQLAGSDLIKQADFDKIATDLNGNLTNAAKTLNLNESKDTGEGFALFSAVASDAARNYIEHKRTEDLIAVLQANQSAVEKFSAQGVAAGKLVAQEWQSEYIRKKGEWAKAYVAAKDDAGKLAVIDAVLSGNDGYTATLKTLQLLDAAYGALPLAHRELLESLEKKKPLTAEIALLVADGKGLDALYKQLSKPAAQTQPASQH